MPVILPLVPSIANYRFGCALNGDQFLIDVRWNARDVAWYMDVRAADATPIRCGLKLVLGALIGDRCISRAFPWGAFVMVDTTGKGRDATFDDIGVRVQLWFYTRDEVVAAFAL